MVWIQSLLYNTSLQLYSRLVLACIYFIALIEGKETWEERGIWQTDSKGPQSDLTQCLGLGLEKKEVWLTLLLGKTKHGSDWRETAARPFVIRVVIKEQHPDMKLWKHCVALCSCVSLLFTVLMALLHWEIIFSAHYQPWYFFYPFVFLSTLFCLSIFYAPPTLNSVDLQNVTILRTLLEFQGLDAGEEAVPGVWIREDRCAHTNMIHCFRFTTLSYTSWGCYYLQVSLWQTCPTIKS